MWADGPVKSDNYLFPSDHFGLFIDIVPGVPGESREAKATMMSMGEPDPSVEEILCRNAREGTELQAYRPGLLWSTVALAYHTVWLAAVAVGLREDIQELELCLQCEHDGKLNNKLKLKLIDSLSMRHEPKAFGNTHSQKFFGR
ncbi:unnamed protein product, partial [Didymodactylos carnosus]